MAARPQRVPLRQTFRHAGWRAWQGASDDQEVSAAQMAARCGDLSRGGCIQRGQRTPAAGLWQVAADLAHAAAGVMASRRSARRADLTAPVVR